MPDSVVIRAEDLGKKYVIGHETQNERYVALRDVLAGAAKGFARAARDVLRGDAIIQGDTIEDFWALRNVDFEVKRGEVLGIIGRNGAGKSTLLKILSRITEPSEGRVTIMGRVASLLEVGTGFHPELTGRENIYLNGAILGMKRSEIKRKFDEIVAFAEGERFLDTPVKRYSSGMYVRLAFAVAAHLEPEILVVDEVLAVGDAEFQKKCLGKMSQVARGGRTVLFVSHNMQAIRTLCSSVVVLDKGRKTFEGRTERSIEAYLANNRLMKSADWARPSNPKEDKFRFETLAVEIIGAQPSLKLHCSVRVGGQTSSAKAFLAVDIADSLGTVIMQAVPQPSAFIPAAPGSYDLSLEITLPPLVPNTYWLSFWLGPHNTETYDYVANALSFEVVHSPTPERTFPHTADHGYIVPQSRCTLVEAGHALVTQP